ncbi:MAG: hypothetical protein HPY67_10810 [Syntrophaceae bacterium]|nr:hypothetical protein [Syntrophaceae bacterium]
MRDFTLAAYRGYVEAIKERYPTILRFDEYFLADPKPASFCLLKHDVDRRPRHALRMALLERDLDVRSTYYFRAKPHTFIPEVMRQIHSLGHEIGYHYESLSDTGGDLNAASSAFAETLQKFRDIVPVRTVAFHGRPLSRYDNRLLVRRLRQQGAFEPMDLLGDANEDIDYADILYLSDTGRTWDSEKHKLRDRVNSRVQANILTGDDLLTHIRYHPHPRLILLTHPERWSHNPLDWIIQALKDGMTNLTKALVRNFRPAENAKSGISRATPTSR